MDIGNTTCLFRQFAAYAGRDATTQAASTHGTTSGEAYASNKHLLRPRDHVDNYLRDFGSDLQQAKTDFNASNRLAAALLKASGNLAAANRKVLAKQICSFAWRQLTPLGRVKHTPGNCAACDALRRGFPAHLQCAGLPAGGRSGRTLRRPARR